MHILELFFNGLVIGIGATLFASAGGVLISDELKEFSAARICFSLAAVWLLGGIIVWSIFTSETATVRIIATFLAAGLIGVGLSESIRAANKRESVIEQQKLQGGAVTVLRPPNQQSPASESRFPEKVAPPEEKRHSTGAVVITAVSSEKGSDSEGFLETEFTLVPDKIVPPPAVIELEFDHEIFGLSTRPLPAPAGLIGGGDKWDGTHGYATLPALGISPTQFWVVTVKSREPIHLLRRPRLRTGY